MTKLDNSRISKVLGQTVTYPDQYDPTILVSEPRCNNRHHLDIHDDDLPFVGVDVWNAYEVSTLTSKGLPVAGIMKIIYPCNSKYIVESKSLKLYLNSFNMTMIGNTRKEAIDHVQKTVAADLSDLLETEVRVTLLVDHQVHELIPNLVTQTNRTLYETLEDLPNAEDLMIDTYIETPDLLDIICDADTPVSKFFHTSLLKSNCRVTSQPDWGDCFIYIKSTKRVMRMSLLRYLISFRDECHFHEEICETIYKRLYDVYKPEELCVTCLYARRGGIDINPIRASSGKLLLRNLTDINTPHLKTPKQ
jgi:7-cyano-7-deazaguanine reductase